jgi:thioredoxin-related protein
MQTHLHLCNNIKHLIKYLIPLTNKIMAKTLLAIITYLTLITAHVYGQEVNHYSEEIYGTVTPFKGTYKDFLEVAAQQSKPLMVIFCRKDCHSCTGLRRTLSKKEIGDFINRYYISYFIDIAEEKSKLYPLSEKYGVTSTPYAVYMTPDGKVLGQKALSPNKDSIIDYSAKIYHQYMDYQLVVTKSKCGNDPECQRKLAETFAARYRVASYGLSPSDYLKNLLTYRDKRFEIFNRTFLSIATSETVSNENGGYEVDAISEPAGTACKNNKRLARWKRWLEH